MEMVLLLQWLHVHNADGFEGGSPAICFRPPGHQKVDTFRYFISLHRVYHAVCIFAKRCGEASSPKERK